MFAGYLAWSGLAPGTIRQTMFAVQSAHKRASPGDPLAETTRLWISLEALQRDRPPATRKLDVTTEMLLWLTDVLQRDGADEIGYRQSGLNDNNSKLGGVTSLRYYGELFDPELANIGITTLTASIRPFEGASATLVFHTYRQDVASATTPNTDLRTTPTGRSADLGRELDLVLGYRFGASLTLEVIAARFEPGSAWATDSAAHLLVITSRLSF